MTKEIQTREGDSIICDDEDEELLSHVRWRTRIRRNYKHPVSIGGCLEPHRLLMKHVKGKVIDHINRNPFDNRKSNLRYATKQENNWNCSKRIDSKRKFKGVSRNRNNSKKAYIATITYNHKLYYLGSFYSEKEAALRYNKAASYYFKNFAALNEIDEEIKQMEFDF